MSGHMKGSEKMPIARFVNAEEIVQLWNEVNPVNKIGRETAYGWRDDLLAAWEKKRPNIPLPCKTKKIIPYVWIEEWIGEDVYKGLVLDALTLAQLDVLRLNENMSRSEFIGKIINEYKAKEKDVLSD